MENILEASEEHSMITGSPEAPETTMMSFEDLEHLMETEEDQEERE